MGFLHSIYSSSAAGAASAGAAAAALDAAEAPGCFVNLPSNCFRLRS